MALHDQEPERVPEANMEFRKAVCRMGRKPPTSLSPKSPKLFLSCSKIHRPLKGREREKMPPPTSSRRSSRIGSLASLSAAARSSSTVELGEGQKLCLKVSFAHIRAWILLNKLGKDGHIDGPTHNTAKCMSRTYRVCSLVQRRAIREALSPRCAKAG